MKLKREQKKKNYWNRKWLNLVRWMFNSHTVCWICNWVPFWEWCQNPFHTRDTRFWSVFRLVCRTRVSKPKNTVSQLSRGWRRKIVACRATSCRVCRCWNVETSVPCPARKKSDKRMQINDTEDRDVLRYFIRPILMSKKKRGSDYRTRNFLGIPQSWGKADPFQSK